MDEHRLGLKPITRGVWAPEANVYRERQALTQGERPIALGHHRYEWLYVWGFVEPATGNTVWSISNGSVANFYPSRSKAYPRTQLCSECSKLLKCGLIFC
jgi:hypothetical protein